MGSVATHYSIAKDFFSAIYENVPICTGDERMLRAKVSVDRDRTGMGITITYPAPPATPRKVLRTVNTGYGKSDSIDVSEPLGESEPYGSIAKLVQREGEDIFILKAQMVDSGSFRIGLARGEERETRFYGSVKEAPQRTEVTPDEHPPKRGLEKEDDPQQTLF
jgi:hypothetical protein